MKKLLTLIILTFISTGFVYADTDSPDSPVGIWKTIDDVTGKPKAIVQVWQSADNKLYGKILKVFPRPGIDLNAVCTACEGKRHNQPISGMIFLESLKRSRNNQIEWNGGKILDPKNGKTYNCSLQVADSGQKLNVRGYLGLPLFGRSQTWVRESGATA